MKRLLAIALLLCSPTWAAWYNASWSHRASVEIDATYVDEAVPIIPVYLSFFDSTWHGAVQADADDIIVTQSDGTTALEYYLVAYDSGADTGLIIVNVDGYISASSNVTIYVYVGNSGASAGSDAAATIGATDYTHWYFPGHGTTDLAGSADLSAGGTPGTTASGIEGLTAATYDGSTNYHYTTTNVGAYTWPFSMEAIAYTTNTTGSTANQCIVGLATTSGTSNYSVLRFRGDLSSPADPIQGSHQGNGGGLANANTSTGYSTSTNYYVATSRATVSGVGDSYAWINGGSQGTHYISVNALSGTDRIGIGNFYSSTSTLKLAGRVSWAAISTVARSANYVATMYDAWFTTAFRTYGATEAQPSGDTGWLEFTAAATSAGGGTTNWTSASNALTSLATAATADIPDSVLSYQLNLTDASAAITGLLDEITKIEIEVVATGEDAGSEELVDENIQLIIGGSLSGADKSDVTAWTDASQVTRVYTWQPSAGDTMPTPAQVDASNFGVSLQFYSQGGAQALMTVYRVRVRIYSGAPATGSGFFGLLE